MNFTADAFFPRNQALWITVYAQLGLFTFLILKSRLFELK
jgi:hypothetical protein